MAKRKWGTLYRFEKVRRHSLQIYRSTAIWWADLVPEPEFSHEPSGRVYLLVQPIDWQKVPVEFLDKLTGFTFLGDDSNQVNRVKAIGRAGEPFQDDRFLRHHSGTRPVPHLLLSQDVGLSWFSRISHYVQLIDVFFGWYPMVFHHIADDPFHIWWSWIQKGRWWKKKNVPWYLHGHGVSIGGGIPNRQMVFFCGKSHRWDPRVPPWLRKPPVMMLWSFGVFPKIRVTPKSSMLIGFAKKKYIHFCYYKPSNYWGSPF